MCPGDCRLVVKREVRDLSGEASGAPSGLYPQLPMTPRRGPGLRLASASPPRADTPWVGRGLLAATGTTPLRGSRPWGGCGHFEARRTLPTRAAYSNQAYR